MNQKEYNINYYQEHKKELQKRSKINAKTNRIRNNLTTLKWQKENPDKANAKSRKWYNKTKGRLFNIILDHYSHRCNCTNCPETNERFLTVDHINNDGKAHHDKIGSTIPVYKDVIKQEFPITIQILCMNCNWGKHAFGICPHKTK